MNRVDIPKPADLYKNDSLAVAREVTGIVNKLTELLKQNYSSQARGCTIAITGKVDEYYPYKYRSEISEKFRENGWTLTIENGDQRDDYTNLKFSHPPINSVQDDSSMRHFPADWQR